MIVICGLLEGTCPHGYASGACIFSLSSCVIFLCEYLS